MDQGTKEIEGRETIRVTRFAYSYHKEGKEFIAQNDANTKSLMLT